MGECSAQAIAGGTRIVGTAIFAAGGVVSGMTINGNQAPGSTGIITTGCIASRIEGNTVSRWNTRIHASAPGILVVRSLAAASTTNHSINFSVAVVPL